MNDLLYVIPVFFLVYVVADIVTRRATRNTYANICGEDNYLVEDGVLYCRSDAGWEEVIWER